MCCKPSAPCQSVIHSHYQHNTGWPSQTGLREGFALPRPPLPPFNNDTKKISLHSGTCGLDYSSKTSILKKTVRVRVNKSWSRTAEGQINNGIVWD